MKVPGSMRRTKSGKGMPVFRLDPLNNQHSPAGAIPHRHFISRLWPYERSLSWQIVRGDFSS